MNGVIILDKPEGFTSFDAVAVMRGLTGERKIGHTGTLDPMATGVLPILIGRAAKAAGLLTDTDKRYCAAFKLGMQTDTGDSTGQTIKQTDCRVGLSSLERSVAAHTGKIMQLPPMYSAVSVDGQRLYKLARAGIAIDRPLREVEIKELKISCFDEDSQSGELNILCSKGTYIRTLIEDIAAAAGTLGTMTGLRRTMACGFTIERSSSLDVLRRSKENIDKYMLGTDELFNDLQSLSVSCAQTVRVLNGGALSLERIGSLRQMEDGQKFRLYSPNKEFLALGSVDISSSSMKIIKLFKLR